MGKSMRIGVSIKPVFSGLNDLQEFLEEIFVEAEGVNDIEVHTNDLDKFDIFLLNIARKFGVKYSVHCPHLYSEFKVNFCSSDKKDIKNSDLWLKKSIEYAKKLGAKNIIIHPDVPNEGTSREKALDILEKHIKDNLKYLKKGFSRQRILIENMPSDKYLLSTPEEFEEFLKRFSGKFANRVAVCWDVGHEIGRFRRQEFFFPKVLKSKIKEVHVSGVKRFSDHYSLKDSELNLARFVESLKNIKYKGAIIFEIVTNNPLDIIESKKILEKFL